MFRISRWKPAIASNIIPSALALAASLPADATTITAAMHSDLPIIDPGFTTAYISRDHGYMVDDALPVANMKVIFLAAS
jgi:peptide/nickel transport system substrate-binding protein